MTSRIQAPVNWKVVTFGKSGHLDIESVNELQRLFGLFGPDRKFILDLKHTIVRCTTANGFSGMNISPEQCMLNSPELDRYLYLSTTAFIVSFVGH